MLVQNTFITESNLYQAFGRFSFELSKKSSESRTETFDMPLLIITSFFENFYNQTKLPKSGNLIALESTRPFLFQKRRTDRPAKKFGFRLGKPM